MSNILAIDIGYGHVKWVARCSSGETHKGVFPSVAPVTTQERQSEGIGMANLRTVTVNVGANNYIVGRDAYLEADSNYGRSRLQDYSQTEGYRALMLGAMSLSGMRAVDQLVIGLPLSTLSTYHSALQTQYVGEHQIGGSTAKRKVEVTVKNVVVTSQPVGAMLNAVGHNPRLREGTNLVIDMGYFTMDFLMCEGLRPFYARSGAIQGGMSAYYDHLSGLLVDQMARSGGIRQASIDHFRLERALSAPKLDDGTGEGCRLHSGNQATDMSEAMEKSSIKIHEYIDRMVTKMGMTSLPLINSVVLAGGGGRFIRSAVQQRLGNTCDYVDLDNAQFAIAFGYVELGVAAAKRATATV